MGKTMFAKLGGAALLGALVSSTALAETLEVNVEIPRLRVAEYHQPYVALWLEDESHKAMQLAVWYDVEMRDNEGKTWLNEMRQWWRRGGRRLEMPVDGITSATRGPGEHRVALEIDAGELAQLAPGEYRLRVEASREVGGRELVEIPLTWPLEKAKLPLSAQGENELGRVTVNLSE